MKLDSTFAKPALALVALVALVLAGKLEAAAVVTFIGGLFLDVPRASKPE